VSTGPAAAPGSKSREGETAQPPWYRTKFALGAYGLLTIVVFLCAGRWRWSRSQRQNVLNRLRKNAPDDQEEKSRLSMPEAHTNGALDLRLLRHLGDDTADGLARQIKIYLTAFDSDLRMARSIFVGEDRKKIHYIAHRLLAHAGVVNSKPLIDLATTIQSESAVLGRQELDQLLQNFEREFAELRSKLDSLQT
jgi:HPt (histidine-containing phosphotransfer) domain-containing protein